MLVGIAWIWASDQIVLSQIPSFDLEQATFLQSTKGFLFIFFTSSMLYFLVKNSCRRLSESEQRYKRLFEESPVPKVVYEEGSTRILDVNKAACSRYGYNKQEFSVLPLKELYPEPDHCFKEESQFFKPQNGSPSLAKHKKKNGSPFYVQIHSSATQDEESEADLFIALDVHDKIIAEQKSKEARRELIKREKLFRSLVDSQTNYLIRVDREGRYTYVNRRFCEKFGFTAEQLKGQHYQTTVLPEDWNKCKEVEKICEEKPGTIVSIEIRKKDKEGNIIWANWEFIGVTSEEGEIAILQGVGQDITSRKVAELEINNSVRKLDTILDNIGEGFFSIGKDWTVTKVNREFERILKTKATDIVGKNVLNAIPELENSPFTPYIKKAMKEGIHLNFEEYSPRLQVWLQVNIYPLPEGGIAGYLRDVSQKNKSEWKAKQALERYEMIAKATKDVAYDWEFDTDRLSWNSATLTSMRYQPQEVEETIQWWEARLHPEDKERVISGLYQAIKDCQESWSSEYRFLCGDKEYRHFQERGYILYNEKQEPVRMVGIIQDVHAQKKAQKEITQLSLVAQKTQNSVIISDKEGRIEWVNEGFTRQTGYMLNEVVGKKPGSFLQGPLTDKETVQTIRTKLNNQEKFTAELINYRKDGSSYWMRMFVSPIFNEQKELVQYIAIETDITERKQFIAKLERQNAQLKEVAWISSHEIRRPVASILGLLSLYDSKQPDTPFNQEIIQHLGTATKELDGVIHRIVNKTYEVEELSTPYKEEKE